VNGAIACVAKQWDRIDVLVNNVGGSMGIAKPVEDITLEEFEKVLALNLRGTFLCCRAVIPVMKKNRHGRIINMSSMAGRSRSVFGGTPYAAAKSAILGFTRQASRDLGRHGITINAVAPGTIVASERIREYWEVNRTEEERRMIVDMAPVGRMGDALDVARCVLFLADEGASYITGSVLDVNGGAWVG
jgi:NAD(P)-dependent dehydrogenase (short-subunit alcohol dehydrogenase family)